MPLIPIIPTPKNKNEWSEYVKRAKTELTEDDAEYKSLNQSDHPGCQVVIGITDTGGVSTTGYVECGVKLVRRVTKVSE